MAKVQDYTKKLTDEDVDKAHAIGHFTRYNLVNIMKELVKIHYERCSIELPTILEVVRKNAPIHMLKGKYPYTCLSCGKIHYSIEEDNFCSFCGIGFIWVKEFPKMYHRTPYNQNYFIGDIRKQGKIEQREKMINDFRIDYWDKTYKRGKYKE